MTLPFTVEQFFGVFAAYNALLWPAHWSAILVSLHSMSHSVPSMR